MKSSVNEPIAVIGLACRYPGASSPVELWENVLTQRQQFRQFPDVRMPLADYYDADPAAPDKTYGRKGAFMDGFEFDRSAHRVPKMTFETTDIVHWLALSTALDALKQAGLSRDTIARDKAGVILGNTLTGEQTRANTLRLRWPFVRKMLRRTAALQGLSAESALQFESTMEQLYTSVFPPVTEDTLAGGLANTIAGRICNYLDLHGGGYIVDGACSSSLLAIATAADYLQQHKMDLVITGGIDISMDAFELVGFAKATALTKDEMRVYDRRGKGFIPGEGCGMVLLKRLEDARRDGDKVYAVLRGWGISSDGRGGLTAPSAKGQTQALVRAYEGAGYAPQTLDFIEGHGTGTTVGDRIELEGVAGALHAFGEVPDHSIGMTSFKSIVGHTKAAAGIGGFIKTVIAVNRRVIPPTAGCVEPHGCFADVARGLYPVQVGRIKAQGAPLRAGVSAMGFGGINSHVTLESGDAPAPELAPSVPEKLLLASHQASEVVPFSGAKLTDLIAAIQSARAQASGLSSSEVIDFAAHHAASLRPLPWRAAVVVTGVDDLETQLRLLEERLEENPPAKGEHWHSDSLWISNAVEPQRVGFLFPGQGSQKVGMARKLVDRFESAQEFIVQSDRDFAAVRAEFDEATEETALSSLFLRRSELDPAGAKESDWMVELTKTEHAQPAICAASWLWRERLESLGIRPSVVGGHSLGELTAFAAAGGYGPSTLVQLAAYRGGVMAAQPGGSGSMAAISSDGVTVQGLLDQLTNSYCVIANYNSPKQTVISGETEAVARIVEVALAAGLQASVLPVSHAFHSQLVYAAADTFKTNPAVPETVAPLHTRMISSLDGREIHHGLDIRQYLSQQIVSPVNFSKQLETMSEHCDWLIEVGPSRVLSGLARAHAAARVRPCLPVESKPGRDADFNAVVAEAFIRGMPLQWEHLYAGRFVRPLVSAAQRKFWVNPCEQEPVLPAEALLAVNDLGEQFRLLDAANGSKKASLPFPVSNGAPPPEPGDAHSPWELLLELVMDVTGFSRDSLAADQRLLDDLNIDSIKAASLLGQLLVRTGTQTRVSGAALSNATLGEIAAKVNAAMSETPAAGEEVAAAKSTARWVRDFTVGLVKSAATPALSPVNALLVAPGGVPAYASGLADRLGVPLLRDILDQPGSEADTLVLLLAASADPDQTFFDGVDQLASLQRLATARPQAWKRLTRVVFVQSSGSSPLGAALPPPTAWSFAGSLSLENPHLGVAVIALDPALPESLAAAKIAGELGPVPGYSTVVYDAQGERWTRCMQLVKPEDSKPRQISWSPQDVILVTGGGKGITAECALAWARETGAKLALIGRSRAPAHGERGELADNLHRFSELGIDYRYYAADVADRAAMATVLAQVRTELGPVTAVLHGAGSNLPRRLVDVSAEQARAEIAPKLQGAANLLALLDPVPLKLVTAFTSIIGVTGMQNNAWYAYSNERVARLIEEFGAAHPATATMSYAFGVWDSVGMGVKLGSVKHLETMGIDAIPLSDGVAHFMRWTRAAPLAGEVIVTASSGGLATWAHPPAAPQVAPVARFAGTIQRHDAGIERITRVELSAEHDLYLLDHNYRGSLLMPTVMGLEAMAQASLSLVNLPDLEVTSIEDIDLSHPIVVGAGRPMWIEIRALARERLAASDPHVVEVSILTEQTGFKQAHFSARMTLGVRGAAPSGPTAPPLNGILPILPCVDLYGSLLFQGPLFQRISAVESLSNDHITFVTEACSETVASPGGFSDAVRGPLLLGDPFYRDTLLQAGQLCLTPEICLPIRISRIELFSTGTPAGRYRAEARLLGRVDRDVSAEINVFDQTGTLVERITGYVVRVLETSTVFPTPANLAKGGAAPERTALLADLEAHARALDVALPEVILRSVPPIVGRERKQRRQLLIPLMHAAIRGAAARQNLAPQPSDVRWLDSGKPVVVHRTGEQSPLGISLSHDDALVLCVSGTGPQGCDLAAVEHRSRAEWEAMLGAPAAALLLALEANGESLDRAGTRVWAAMEAALKALDSRTFTLRAGRSVDSGVIVEATAGERTLQILTIPTRAVDGVEHFVALVVASPVGATEVTAARPQKQQPVSLAEPLAPVSLTFNRWSDWLTAGGDTADFLSVRPDFTVDKQGRRLRFRFPLGFKDGANLDGSFYFVRFFEWMGRLREIALRPVLGKLSEQFARGEYAWVTNNSWAHVERPFYAGEVVEVACRFLGRGGPDDSIVSVGFEWSRVNAGGRLEVVGSSQIRMTWAKVIGHGVVKPQPYPKYLDDFFQELTASDDPSAQGDAAYHQEATRKAGKLRWAKKHGPTQGKPLSEQRTETSINDANLVGNIYYTKYYEMQGILRDNFFQRLIPAAYQHGAGTGAGIRCLYTEVRNLRDVMPFDTLMTVMYLNAVYESGFELGFDYFRLNKDGAREKLATGLQVAAWMTAGEDGRLQTITELPTALAEQLLSGVDGAAPRPPAARRWWGAVKSA